MTRLVEEEPSRSGRSDSKRDRDRILYSSAFQRLTGITQVTSAETGHVFHNRLTHSLKVAQFGSSLAAHLLSTNAGGITADELDPDAVEAAALAHDIGHPPFGHIAEHELDVFQSSEKSAGVRFEGNAQSLRTVSRLSVKSRSFDGLNLCKKTLNGMLKYPRVEPANGQVDGAKWGVYESERDVFEFARGGETSDTPCIEAQIMDWADDVTYAVHDFEDFYCAGLISPDHLVNTHPSFKAEFQRLIETAAKPDSAFRKTLRGHVDGGENEGVEQFVDAYNFLFKKLDIGEQLGAFRNSREQRADLKMLGSTLITRYARDAVEVKRRPDGAWELAVDPTIRGEVAFLKQLIWSNVILRPSMAVVQHGQKRIIRELLESYADFAKRESKWHMFPLPFRELLQQTEDEDASRERIAIDFIASLSEPMAIELHSRMSGGSDGSLLDAIAHALG